MDQINRAWFVVTLFWAHTTNRCLWRKSGKGRLRITPLWAVATQPGIDASHENVRKVLGRVEQRC